MGNDGRFRYYQCGRCKLVNYDLATGLGQEQFTVLDKDPTDDSDPWNLEKDQEVVVANFLEVDAKSISEEPFDLVCLRHVLEHLPDCRLAMQKLRELLKPGGHILIEIPNVESVSKKVKRFMTRLGLRRTKYPADLVIGHTNEFCKFSFEYLLKETEFELVRWETYSKKPVSSFIYNRVHVGSNARAIIRYA